MVCPKCGSSQVHAQVVTDARLVDQHHGCLWWIVIGWWWLPVKWIFLTMPALLAKIFIPKRQKIKTTQRTVFVCQHCGQTWNA